LFPGLVALGALTIFSWAVFAPGAALSTPKLSGAWWIAIFVCSYILGHLVQAVANMIPWLRPKSYDALAWTQHETTTPAKLGLHRRDGEDHGAYASRAFEAADIVVAQRGNTDDRQIYQYREGFYRGLTMSFALALVAVIVRALHDGDAFIAQHHFITSGEYAFAASLLFVAALLSHHRYLRFSAFKLHNTFVAFALLDGEIQLPKQDA
jgi:hypothetical protein